ncbi:MULTISPECIES: cell division topological specificity factor MinE [unclassified Aureimonas]|uniref:cell division topological specificity factor MinE n=1 Tax=unclassified Aureimonas TaxID=2615206 RepID=UPI0006F36B6A|nr:MULTISPECIES: cell division topological specificity factor MinE [unclassified Aureimonas]KQT60663.1 cell division topological specificity factor [Aureimonas sp. Leaf460]KQT68792.1 cell division topological specificity factor [Aureimonas sp. Leaf427]
MTIFSSFFSKRSTTAPAARERLQVLLAHERASIGQSDLVAVLREEILAVIAKHVAIDRDQVKVKMQKGDAVSTLEVDIELPVLASRASVADAPDRTKFAQIRRA